MSRRGGIRARRIDTRTTDGSVAAAAARRRRTVYKRFDGWFALTGAAVVTSVRRVHLFPIRFSGRMRSISGVE